MFFTVFATIASLFTLYGQTNSNNHDYSHLVGYRHSSSSESNDDYVQYSVHSANTGLGTTQAWQFNSLSYLMNGDSGYDKHLRYYICSDVTNQVELGYLEFYLYNAGDTGGHLYPTIEAHFSETFNFQLSVDWAITNSDFPSITPFEFQKVFDFSRSSDINYQYIQQEDSSMYTIYTNANGKNATRFLLNGVPMDNDAWSKANTNYENGYWDGYNEGYDDGKDYGYVHGYADGQDNQMNPEMFTIFNGILNVAMIPVNVFLGIFNFEVFGINISALVASLLSICILVVVIRLITGASSKGD